MLVTPKHKDLSESKSKEIQTNDSGIGNIKILDHLVLGLVRTISKGPERVYVGFVQDLF